ncbi:MAG: phosphatase PAP2 family protein [Saprospiraceae bacterium]|nr:phosphatase PAP2 family protein [Saprospiraceae bacterium]
MDRVIVLRPTTRPIILHWPHFSMVFGWKNWKIRYAFMAWATMIALAQVYVGLHYPFDVIGGALLGSFIGFIIAKTGERWIGYDTEHPDTV